MASTEHRHTVTLREIAREAGVSVSTVSRILDERATPSRSTTAQRVRSIADQLGYRRNAAASNLRRGESGTIGVLVPRLSDQVMALMFEAIERAARQRGQFAVVATCGDDPDNERQATETLLNRGVDSLVLATARLDDSLPASLRDRGIPHVLALRTDGISPASLGDDETGGYLAARHLVDLGHRDIAIVTGPWYTSSGRDRRTGAERALSEAGLDLPETWVHAVGYGLDDGWNAGRELLSASTRPTAIFAANDNLALGVVNAAGAQGLMIGRDVSVVGYNDIPLVSRIPTPLTSVRTPFEQIAEAALRMLGSGETGTAIAMPTLIPRASTGRPLT